MNARPAIHKVTYQWGMADDPANWHGLQTAVFEGPNVPDDVVAAIFDNDVLAAGGVYGIPDAGDPVEISSLQIAHDEGVTEITVYNLGIMWFSTDEEIYPRIVRVCSAIRRHAEGRWLETSGVDRSAARTASGPAKSPARPVRENPQVYQVKVVLLKTDPPIWRRFLILSHVTLHHLHLVLQAVMGWTNSHLYRFQVGNKEYGEPSPDIEAYDPDLKNSGRTKLAQLALRKRSTFRYEYDFGDGWLHKLVIEDIFEPKPDTQYPVCVAGERACPPEDCGGPYGYAELLEIIANPGHEEYPDRMMWLGGPFDPEEFDVNGVNVMLRAMRL